MGQVKRISDILSAVLLCLLVNGCSRTGVPPEMGYAVARFKQQDYREYVLTVPYNEHYLLFIYGASDKNFQGYDLLHGDCLMSRQLIIPESCAVSVIRWEDYSITGHRIHFYDNEIMDSQPLSAYYWIPERALNDSFDGYPASPEAIDSINAMIDDGRIERYRVDLGY